MVNKIVPLRPKNTQAEWLKAAETWRLPFWDWAIKPMSKYISEPVLSISVDGEQTKLPNPMYKFKMPQDKTMGDYGVGDIRNPDTYKVLKVGLRLERPASLAHSQPSCSWYSP